MERTVCRESVMVSLGLLETHALCCISNNIAWITPTRVHRSNGPRKYDIPVCSVSMSIRLSWRATAACENSVAEIWRRIWGLVVLRVNDKKFLSEDRKEGHYRSMASSIPSLLLSNMALNQVVNADLCSGFNSST
jgi:hypothetical protein